MAEATITVSKPALTVYTYDSDHEQFSPVIFNVKLHFRLRYAGIPYDEAFGTRNTGPKGKVPYVKFADTGELMGDSELIIKRLTELGKMEDLNAGLSAPDRARDFCLKSMIEDRMNFFLVGPPSFPSFSIVLAHDETQTYERFYENYDVMAGEDGPFTYVPAGIRRRAFTYVSSKAAKLILYLQGTGRHSIEEVHKFQEEAVGALNDFATDALRRHPESQGPFWILGGEQASEADFITFGYLATCLATKT
jgi:hypothetical protein